ncbi:hypothetical protein J6590_039168 [Homalodisca vitripennis]|nr:hypothetical protein J6590_039168 [Homalodisca vitripennis]
MTGSTGKKKESVEWTAGLVYTEWRINVKMKIGMTEKLETKQTGVEARAGGCESRGSSDSCTVSQRGDVASGIRTTWQHWNTSPTFNWVVVSVVVCINYFSTHRSKRVSPPSAAAPGKTAVCG